MFSSAYVVDGPHRIVPGKLSISRSFGDILAKDSRFGGNPRVLLGVPEVTKIQLRDEMDCVVIGCKLQSTKVTESMTC